MSFCLDNFRRVCRDDLDLWLAVFSKDAQLCVAAFPFVDGYALEEAGDDLWLAEGVDDLWLAEGVDDPDVCATLPLVWPEPERPVEIGVELGIGFIRHLRQVMAAIAAVNPLILLCKLNGKQMISLLIGTGGALASNFGGGGELGFDGFGWKYGLHTRRLVTFSLYGKAVVPEQPAPQLAKPIFDKEFKVDEAKAAAGGCTYAVHLCVSCHGGGAVAGVRAPDLRESPHLLHGSTSRSRTSSVAEIFSKRVCLDSQC